MRKNDILNSQIKQDLINSFIEVKEAVRKSEGRSRAD